MTPKTGMTPTLAALLVGGAFVTTQAIADAPDALGTDIEVVESAPDSYVNAQGNAIKTGLSECLRLGGWNDDDTIDSCEGIEATAEEPEAAPEPEPVVEREPVISTSMLDAEALFNTNESTLTASSEATLADLLAQLENFDDISAIKLTGHTDDRGTEDYNQALSEARAQSVRRFLSSAYPNVPIQARGEGELNPVASNATPEGRQQNRRVDVEVTAKSVIQN